jgi:RimJ/RimL family protein N-acetyltransferase
MAEVQLETERIILRDWRDEDWPEFFRLTNTPSVMRWLGGVMDEPAQAAQRARVAKCAADYGHCFWAVEHKMDGGRLSGELLGFCGLKRADAPGCPVAGQFEVGWRLREDAWGKGYAREAATASLDTGFRRFGAEEIFALTVIQNSASWGLMERLGMRRRAELDFPDERYEPEIRDTIVYSIARGEWTGA